jgi:two-component system chemotaxis response regulator CheY
MKTILIVEDSSMTRSMMRAIVEDMEDEVVVVEAATGFEALKMIPAHELDLIITDINMPDINGLELINFVKKDEKYKSIPLLIVSTERSEDDKRRGMALGADDYVTKPFQPKQLQDAIENLLKV